MGRAPATALAYMNWIRGIQLDEGHKLLTSLRRCGPKVCGVCVCVCVLGVEGCFKIVCDVFVCWG